MTCEHLQSLLLTESTDGFDAYQAHLHTCQSCAALAAAILASEDVLRDHLESEMTSLTFDNAWSNATEAPLVVDRRLRWVPMGFVAAAALAIGAVVVWSALPQPPPVDPPRIEALSAAPALPDAALRTAEAYDAVPLLTVDELNPNGGREQDEIIRGSLREKTRAFNALRRELQPIISNGTPGEKILAIDRLGDGFVSLGEFTRDLPPPTYLNADQTEVYTISIQDRVFSQYAKAVECWKEALRIATERGDAGTENALNAKIERYSSIRP